jgi:hypothetical protein
MSPSGGTVPALAVEPVGGYRRCHADAILSGGDSTSEILPTYVFSLTDPAAIWQEFLTSPTAPKRAMSMLELGGYLTGVILALDSVASTECMTAL